MVRRDEICKVEDCNKANNYGGGYGYCGKHYRRFKKFGNPLAYSYRDPNTYRELDDYIEIDLKDMQGNVRGVCLIDLEDRHLLNKKWHLSAQGYAVTNNNGNPKPIHYFIKQYKDNHEIDHANQNKLDNRGSNLRYATRSQNVANRKYKSTTGKKGVIWLKEEKRWRVEITHNYKRVYIGRFNDINEASKAYTQKAKELFGEYAELGVKGVA